MVSLVPFTEILLSTFKRDASEDQDMSMVNQFILLIRGTIYGFVGLITMISVSNVSENMKNLNTKRWGKRFYWKIYLYPSLQTFYYMI